MSAHNDTKRRPKVSQRPKAPDMVTVQPFYRPDLAGVAPTYYPVIEQSRYATLAKLCAAIGVPVHELTPYFERAAIERSDVVVIDRLTLGSPQDGVCAVILRADGGAFVLCAGLLSARNSSLVEVERELKALGAYPQFRNKLLAVGEFRPNPQRVPS